MAGALVVLTAAGWLRQPSVLYLLATTVATVGACWAAARAFRRRSPRRWWRVAVAVLGLAFCASAAPSQYTLGQLERRWPAWEGQALESAAMSLDGLLGRSADQVERLAADALASATGADGGFAELRRLVDSWEPAELSVVLTEGGTPVAWAGTQRISLEGIGDGLGVARTPFYDVLTMAADSGGRRAVATLLLQARPPANALARSLEGTVVAGTAAQAIQFDLAPPGMAPVADAALRLDDGNWLAARVAPLVRDEIALRTLEGARTWGLLWLSLLAGAFLASIWGAHQGLPVRLAGLGVALAAVAVVPLNALSNTGAIFDPTYYFAPLGGALTATVGALTLASGLVLLALLAVLRSRVRLRPRWLALPLVILIAVLGPYLLRDLARGIAAPASGASTSLWLAWQTALFLAATSILLAGISAGRSLLRPGVGLPPIVAPALAAIAALLAQPLWAVPGGWPGWYPVPWIVAVAALALTRRTRTIVMAAAAVAALGAMTLVWGSSSSGRVALAERDVAGLTSVDPVVRTLLERFATDLAASPSPHSRSELLAAYAASDLAAADFAVQLGAWNPGGQPAAQLTDVAGGGMPPELRGSVAEAVRAGTAVVAQVTTPVGVRLTMAVPHPDGWVTTVAVAARTRLFPENLYASLLLGTTPPATEPPYTIALAPTPAGDEEASPTRAEQWTRRGNVVHGDWTESLPDRPVRVHVEVELRSLPVLTARGALVLLLDLAIVLVLWALTLVVERGLPRWVRGRRRQWSRSYRSRLSLALFGFFALPAVVFGVWAARQLQSDARQTRELLVGEALRSAAPEVEELAGVAPPPAEILDRHRGAPPLLLYERGILTAASDDLLTTLAPLGRLLPPDVVEAIGAGAHMAVSRERSVGDSRVLVGYRALASSDEAAGLRPVLAVPAGADELTLDRRRRDLGVLLLLAIAGGALAALWLSGVAARQLARPIGTLREAALAIAAGEREPPLRGPPPPAEFQPVFSAFRRMAADLSASRSALEDAERRTAAVLRQVASAVVAVDADGDVTLFNPAAALLFGRALRPGVPLASLGVPMLEARLARLPQTAGEATEDVVELTLGPRHIHARLTPLRQRGGAVLTLDDVTELARAQRVLAWGEMARQVAHEIKNPLTPIRLGVQHLRRAYGRGREDYERVLDQNVERILAEIDRLDEIARAFSRYGTAPERRGGEPVDVAHVVRDVVELERLGRADGCDEGGEGIADGAGGVTWQMHGADGTLLVMARADELREVLLNLLENARLAGARNVRVELDPDGDAGVRLLVADDGHGIPADVLPRIFEPHFSTRTSGSGLGLAISRRLVESWGGRIVVRSGPGGGTEVELMLAAAAA
ncbi:MAG: ATP-binding protein [Gemmatimonadaceae bacterium]